MSANFSVAGVTQVSCATDYQPFQSTWHVAMVYSSKVILHVLLIAGNHLAICRISIELQVDILARSPINICFPKLYRSISSLQTVLDRLI